MSHVFQLQNSARIQTLFLSSCITHPGLNFAPLKERQNWLHLHWIYWKTTGMLPYGQDLEISHYKWNWVRSGFSSRRTQADIVSSLIWAPDWHPALRLFMSTSPQIPPSALACISSARCQQDEHSRVGPPFSHIWLFLKYDFYFFFFLT